MCVMELQNKAKSFSECRFMQTLDAHWCIAKSDEIMSTDLRLKLGESWHILACQSSVRKDDSCTLTVVDPSLFCLVYGRSSVMQEQCVGVANSIAAWAGKGAKIARPTSVRHVGKNVLSARIWSGKPWLPRDEIWSEKFQWLPANFDAATGQFSSYINNVHPELVEVYRIIERCVQETIPMWDRVLRTSRLTYTDQALNPGGSRFILSSSNDIRLVSCRRSSIPAMCGHMLTRRSEAMAAARFDPPKPRKEIERWVKAFFESNSGEILCYKDVPPWAEWYKTRKAVCPEPDRLRPVHRTSCHDDDHGDDHAGLQMTGGNVQIVVEMGCIDLTPLHPEQPEQAFQIDGNASDNICASAIWYFDDDNVTETDIAFRMQTPSELQDFHDDLGRWEESFRQHRIGATSLKDRTKPGHRRYMILRLVDPAIPIISTANVPPQQARWWAELLPKQSPCPISESVARIMAAMTCTEMKATNCNFSTQQPWLPNEIIDMITGYAQDDSLMTDVEAEKYRQEDLAERRWIQRLLAKETEQRLLFVIPAPRK
ncbi:hypothetical protein MRB53_040957 [Persea americana]|nr:hypothetical protein MRB53_040957 [Persea americana]